MISFSRVNSGVKGLDEILNYQQTDDNVVMQVDDTPRRWRLRFSRCCIYQHIPLCGPV